ncbi:hypothetical protein RJ640_021728 [Escallonia rubra]|uniref:INO80 complex subunit B-like conserved region domain-containing protein n=1 Tax=Escallonia rubra TaxID=112253 RepID=A0AA88U249_9ASTE|nr:hypothetical protein RJ640_021728 [Escallonia rubra]
MKKRRTQTSRRPRPESQPFPESRERSSLTSTPSDDMSKVSSDEYPGFDTNSKRKLFNLNQCVTKGSSTTTAEGENSHKKIKRVDGGSNVLYSNGVSRNGTERGRSGFNNKKFNDGSTGMPGNEVGNETKLKSVTLKVGGVTRTIQTKPGSQGALGSGSSTKTARSSDAARSRPKLILQDNSDEDHSPPTDRKIGLQGVPWKDFSRGGFNLGKEDYQMGKMPEKNASKRQVEKSERVRKSRRVPKRRVLDGEFDEDEDDEIRYLEKLEKLKSSKVSAGYKDVEEEQCLDRVSKGGRYEKLEDFGPSKSAKDGKKSKSERVSGDIDYEAEEQLVSDSEAGGKKKKKPKKDSPDLPTESKRETTLTTRQRALLGKETSSASGLIEFPNGLPPPAPRKQKEKLTEVELQLKKAEAAERRRMQNEKAAKESEAEAIRKILGQDSSRKKREDKLKKRQEELAQEKAANWQMLASNTIRCVMSPTGTVVTFSDNMGLPRIFDPKPCSYPPPRENCAGPSCGNPYKYRDSKSKLPLCSLQCYKAIHEKMRAETSC